MFLLLGLGTSSQHLPGKLEHLCSCSPTSLERPAYRDLYKEVCLTLLLTLRIDHPLVSQQTDFSCAPLRNLGWDHPCLLSETAGPPRTQHRVGVPFESPPLVSCFHSLDPYSPRPFPGGPLITWPALSLSGHCSICLRIWQSLQASFPFITLVCFPICFPGWIASPSRPALYLVDRHIAVLHSTYYIVHASKCLQNR